MKAHFLANAKAYVVALAFSALEGLSEGGLTTGDLRLDATIKLLALAGLAWWTPNKPKTETPAA